MEKKILDRLDVSYERAYMVTLREEYFTEMLDHLTEYIEHHSKQLSSKNILEDVLRFMEE